MVPLPDRALHGRHHSTDHVSHGSCAIELDKYVYLSSSEIVLIDVILNKIQVTSRLFDEDMDFYAKSTSLSAVHAS